MCNSSPALYLGVIGGIMTVKVKIMQNSLAARQEALFQPCPFSLVEDTRPDRLTRMAYGIKMTAHPVIFLCAASLPLASV